MATKEQFNAIQKYIIKVIKNISKEIFSGKIDIRPYYKDNKTPCEYCKFKTICQFDKDKFCNEYNYMPKIKDEDVWDMMLEK